MAAQRPVAIITGASSGIGLAILQALLKADYDVVGTSRNIDRSDEMKGLKNLTVIAGDAGVKQTAIAVTDAAISKYGRIDLLVNNAGIFISKPFTDYTEQDFAALTATNVASFFYMTQQVIPHMQRQSEGHVVSISTTLVNQPTKDIPVGLQVMTKSPMIAASKALAIEYAASGIRFNVISPGIVLTPLHKDPNVDELSKQSPLGRVSETQEIVEAVLYLQSAKSITGENLHVDNGAHAGRW